MRAISRTFVKGLLAILPLGATVLVIVYLAGMAESMLGDLIKGPLPENEEGVTLYYIPGMGILVGLILVFAFGLLLNAWIVRALLDAGERLMQRLPLAKTIFGAVQDMLGFFSSSGDKSMGQVVVVDFAGARVLGFVTRQDLTDLPAAVGGNAKVAVYVPMSYQLGGFTLFVERSKLEPVSMGMEDAMRFVLTAGVKKSGEKAIAAGKAEGEGRRDSEV